MLYLLRNYQVQQQPIFSPELMLYMNTGACIFSSRILQPRCSGSWSLNVQSGVGKPERDQRYSVHPSSVRTSWASIWRAGIIGQESEFTSPVLKPCSYLCFYSLLLIKLVPSRLYINCEHTIYLSALFIQYTVHPLLCLFYWVAF